MAIHPPKTIKGSLNPPAYMWEKSTCEFAYFKYDSFTHTHTHTHTIVITLQLNDIMYAMIELTIYRSKRVTTQRVSDH